MSRVSDVVPEHDQPSEAAVVEEHRDLLERIADTDLQVADRCRDLLDRYEAGDLDG